MLIKDPPVQITGHLWMLGTNAFPVYLYQGERESTLFEGAVSAMGPVLNRQLQELGDVGDKVRQIVVTHAHPDHVMAIPVFRQMFPDASVIASTSAAKTLTIEKAVAFFRKMDVALTDWLVESDVVVESDRQTLPADNQIEVDRMVSEGDEIEVGEGVAYRVFETPGHSHCSLSFFDPHEGVLIISDATGYYLPDQDFMWPGYLTNYDQYLRSIARLADIGAEFLCLSHNAVVQGVEDVAAYFRRAIAETEAYHQRIISQVKSGTSVQEISQELGQDIFARTGQLNLDFFQKNCALLVQNSLRHEGIEAGA